MAALMQMFGGSSGSASVDGNGFVTNIDNVLFGREWSAYGQIRLENGDGRKGPPQIGFEPTIGKLIDASGNITTDQSIPIYGAEVFMIDKIVLCHATAIPVELKGGIYTLANKTGEIIVPASQLYTGLGDDISSVLVFNVAPKRWRVPYLYLSFTTPNGVPIKFDVLVYGTVIVPGRA